MHENRRSPARLGLMNKAGPRRPQAERRTCTCRRSRLCRTTCEPAEQGRATFRGGGEEGHRRGEHRSIAHAPDTEREAHVQGLDGVRKAAKERKQERFTALLHHLNVDLLRDSFFALQRKASPEWTA